MSEAKASAQTYFDAGWKLWLDRKEAASAVEFQRAFDAATGDENLRAKAFDAAAYMNMRLADEPRQFDAFLDQYRPHRDKLPSFVVFEAASLLATGRIDGFWRACSEMPVHDPATMGPWNRGCTTIPRSADWKKKKLADPIKLADLQTLVEPAKTLAFDFTCVFSSDSGYFNKFAAFNAETFNRVEQPVRLHYHIINPDEEAEALARKIGERWKNILITAERTATPQRAYYASRRFILAHDVLETSKKPVFVFDLDLILKKPLTELLADSGWSKTQVGLRVSPKMCLPWQKCTVNLLFLPYSKAGLDFADTMATHLRQALNLAHLGDIWWVDQNAALMAYMQSGENDLQFWGPRAKEYCDMPGLFENRAQHLTAAVENLKRTHQQRPAENSKPQPIKKPEPSLTSKPAKPAAFPRQGSIDVDALIKSPPFNYLTNWSEKGRFVYVETPKVGCTTVKRVLQNHEVGADTSKLHKDVHNKAASPLKSPNDDRKTFGRLIDSPDVLRFCFVRNPFLRVLSAYLDKMVENDWERRRLAPKLGFDASKIPSFEEFIGAVADQKHEEMDIHWAPQAYLLQPRALKYDMIGRFESFQEDFISVCNRLDVTIPDSLMNYGKRHATGAAERAAKFMTPKAVAKIQSVYSDDFLTFGYGWAPPLS